MKLGKNDASWAGLSTLEKLKFLAVVNFDFDHADRAMDLAQSRAKSPSVKRPMEDERYIVYSEAAVVRYSRPFFETRVGTEKLRLPTFYLKNLTAAERQAHDSVTDLRRRVSAHSDNSFKNVTVERVQIGNKFGWTTVVGYQFFAPRELETIRTIMKKIVIGVRADIDAFANHIYPNSAVGTKRALIYNPA